MASPALIKGLLRSSLVNNRTQAKVAEELGMQDFAITNDKTKRPVALRTKTLADLLESFIAALYIDKDLEYVHAFMNVCFFPRLKSVLILRAGAPHHGAGPSQRKASG
uniref:RNase III domain-containing protein n=1 Tax=Knipowitschia caucasica TaxID=637954 RepID=A0AAV2L1V8_KNICA